jgi:hypothetical protein
MPSGKNAAIISFFITRKIINFYITPQVLWLTQKFCV